MYFEGIATASAFSKYFRKLDVKGEEDMKKINNKLLSHFLKSIENEELILDMILSSHRILCYILRNIKKILNILQHESDNEHSLIGFNRISI